MDAKILIKVSPYLFFVLLLMTNCTAISSPNSSTSGLEILEDGPSRWELRRNFYEKGEILVVYNASEQSDVTAYDAFLSSLAKEALGRRNRNIKILHKPSTDVTEEEIKNSVLFLVGTPSTNTLIPRLTKDLPIQYDKDGIQFNKQDFKQGGDLLSFSYYPNPENRQLPFLFLTGNDDKIILEYLQAQHAQGRFISQNMDFEIYRDQAKVIVGGFDRNWRVSQDAYFDFSTGTAKVLETEHFEFVSHNISFEEDGLENLSSMMEQSVSDIQNFFGEEKSLAKVGVHLYVSAEEKGLMLGNTHQTHIEEEARMSHIIYSDQYKNNFIQDENKLFIRDIVGQSKIPWLENGLSIYFTTHWQREGYAYWAARLAESDYALPLSSFFDEDILEYESPMIQDCMAGALVSFLIEDWGKVEFITKYADWSPSDAELKKMENQWQAHLKGLVAEHPKKIRKKEKSNYLKGFNFAHEGYSIYNGYLSTLATTSLRKQADMGANAIAIVPYTGMRDPEKAVPLRISRNAGSENVQGIVHSAHQAKKLGMASMLKPQIWLRGSWPGDIKMDTQEEWDKFFDHYHRWIRHFALIAEIHDIEMFCVGVEFSHATLAQEDKWREIFRNIRKLYQGKMTYAANWGYEFEQVQFWDELDFIGLNCYYPLSKSDNPRDKDLKENFSRIKDKIRKVHIEHKKQIVFTEIGFRSAPTPWKNPHAEEDPTFDPEAQARCYEVIFDGIDKESWCSGILWWKFPSYLDYGGLENNAFTPNNKEAEKVVKKWFTKK